MQYRWNQTDSRKEPKCKCPKAARQKLIRLKCGRCSDILSISKSEIINIPVRVCSKCGKKGYWVYA